VKRTVIVVNPPTLPHDSTTGEDVSEVSEVSVMPQATGHTKLQVSRAPPWQVPVWNLEASGPHPSRRTLRVGVPCIAEKVARIRSRHGAAALRVVRPMRDRCQRLSRKPGSVGKVLLCTHRNLLQTPHDDARTWSEQARGPSMLHTTLQPTGWYEPSGASGRATTSMKPWTC